MIVMMMPESATVARVLVDGKAVGKIEQVTAPSPYEGFDGQMREGDRWLPEGTPPTVDGERPVRGPTNMNEAALLLLALAGYDPEASIKALGLTNPAGKVAVR